MPVLLPVILHLLRLASVTRHPKAGTSLRLVFDRLTGQQVLAADWTDLRHVQAFLAQARSAGVYLIVGRQDGRSRIRVGEGVKLWARLGDHRTDPQIGAFAEQIYVLTSAYFTKSDTVFLQEAFSELVQAEERIDWHGGCGALRDFPLGEDDRKVLDLVVLLGLGLLSDAGLRDLPPARCRLARQIEALLVGVVAR